GAARTDRRIGRRPWQRLLLLDGRRSCNGGGRRLVGGLGPGGRGEKDRGCRYADKNAGAGGRPPPRRLCHRDTPPLTSRDKRQDATTIVLPPRREVSTAFLTTFLNRS